MKPKIIFEDDFLLIVDKPAGMVVNRSETVVVDTSVQDWVEKYLQFSHRKMSNVNPPAGGQMSNVNPETPRMVAGKSPLAGRAMTPPRWTGNEDFYSRSGIVHRLDKETSGLLIIAKDPQSFVNLQPQFKNRQVKKKYLALVHGKVVPQQGEIRAPVGRLPWNRERFGVMPGGREAVTRYKLITNYQLPMNNEQSSLLELYPQTGRTHQIRVHLKYLGHPIVGDSFYAGRKVSREDRKFCPRLFLHASYLSFTHPLTGKKLEFQSSLPDDLHQVLSLII